MKRTHLICLVALALAACERDPTLVACTASMEPALRVAVLDAATGAHVANGAWLVARDGAYADSSTSVIPEQHELAVAHERPGVYDLTVRRAGYQTWTRRDVRVDRNQCHVNTVRLEARLQPAP